MERDVILERIKTRKGNLSPITKNLGIGRTTLWRRMKEYRIEARCHADVLDEMH